MPAWPACPRGRIEAGGDRHSRNRCVAAMPVGNDIPNGEARISKSKNGGIKTACAHGNDAHTAGCRVTRRRVVHARAAGT
ncbi:MAG: hypothetical protein D6826_01795 [Alphaproteobacteria bacterium]|nr:MAG: hypothetical protein D6826_01795 [Alphaproteobacteria bacterium]